MLSLNFFLLRRAKLNRAERKSLAVLFTSIYLDMYDFALYIGYATYLSPLVMPHASHFERLFTLSIIFIAGQLLKLVGIGLYYRLLRFYKINVLLSPVIIGIAYIGMAFLPNYHLSEFYLLRILLLLRLVQGLAFGFEIGFAISNANQVIKGIHKRNIYYFLLFSGELGIVISVLINRTIVANQASLSTFVELWRYQFLAGAVLICINLLLRIRYLRQSRVVCVYSRKFFAYTIYQNYQQILLRSSLLFLQSGLLVMAVFRLPTFLHHISGFSHNKINKILLITGILGYCGSYFGKLLMRRYNTIRLLGVFYALAILINLLWIWCNIRVFYLEYWIYFMGALYGFCSQITSHVLLLLSDFRPHNRLTGRYISYVFGLTVYGSLSILILDIARYFSKTYYDYTPQIIIIVAAMFGIIALDVYLKRYTVDERYS